MSSTSAAARRDRSDNHMIVWVVVGAAIVAAGVVLFVISRRRAPDGVTTFQRQIDALSPEARRSVVDRVQQLDDDARPEGRDTDGP
jgi:hypothetical protein